MVLKVELEKELEHNFREAAMRKHGYAKGSLQKAAKEAISYWVMQQSTKFPKVGDPFKLVEGILSHLKGKKTSVELQDEAKKNLQVEFRGILENIGENPDREGLKKTAEKAAEAFRLLTSGYGQELSRITSGAIYNESNNNMVVMKDIGFYSLCEHHLLPFFGKCHVGYIPDKNVIGLSKVPRIVDMYSRRLQVQERITAQVAEALNKSVAPKGVGVVMEAVHTCVLMRGKESSSGKTITSSVLGIFKKSRKTREEFLRLIGKTLPIADLR